MVWYGMVWNRRGGQTNTHKTHTQTYRVNTATYCTHFSQPMIMHLKYLVNLIYFPFPWEQGLAGEHLSEYAPYGPQVKGGGVFTLS
jgi:hypothetical protein